MSAQTPEEPTAGDPPLTHLRLERPGDGVARLVLDLPDRRNAMSEEMTASWVVAIDHLAADPTVRAVVVTGEGSAFCAGGNTAWLAEEPEASVAQLRAKMQPFYRAWLAIRRLEVPTIAAINGPAIGAGLSLALACDIRYAAADARMGVPFVKLGLHPGMATTHLLPEVVGPAAAKDLLLTGRLVDGHEALALGLVSRVLEGEELASAALQAAIDVAGTAPVASRLTKVALARGHADLEACLDWEALAQPVTMATADLQEGIRAVQERRTPRFEGR
ncbi:enoyl-CoA hydratase/isomerase family protein [Nocardioides panacisoli]|uniref:enoyl-CoA hydratase/isomerase family protein n=1 Tax=Nocardioides panacisoli TaxID=627624 RepID=UPI001C629FB1|nr:enoyl-CoA hydratase/isomerase family protein [Nocardioides panacisoli]QYJ05726.1 enoyl-CoA hydratase/isomerase family protein [Nocardioides panacisoli]